MRISKGAIRRQEKQEKWRKFYQKNPHFLERDRIATTLYKAKRFKESKYSPHQGVQECERRKNE